MTSAASPTGRSAARTVRQALLGAGGILAGVGTGLAGYALWYEPRNVQLEHLTVRLPNGAGRLATHGLRILHLSDTHFMGRNRRERAKIERIRRQVADLDYDLLVHTGDFWHYESGLENVLSLLDTLPKPRFGAFAVLGNHDYTHYAMQEAIPRMWRSFRARERMRRRGRGPSPLTWPWELVRFVLYVRNTPLDGRRSGSNDAGKLTTALEARGFTILHNQAIHLRREIERDTCVDLYLIGVDDVVEGRPHLGTALADVPPEAPTILLSHNPDILESPRIGQVDLVLSGHTHGGQIVLPIWGPAHTQAEFLPRREVSGFFQRGATQVYITRGIGEGIPVRFGARPQFALITVTA